MFNFAQRLIMKILNQVSAIDLFCGIGGLSFGLQSAGINVNAGIDLDDSCRYAFEENCKTTFINKDIQSLTSENITHLFKNSKYKILAGCAPCQPFSSYTYKLDKNEDNRWTLLYEFGRLVEESKPTIVTMENVPTLLNFKKAPVFADFVKKLEATGYYVSYNVIYAPDYGIPQKRKRLVLLASQLGKIELIPPTHKPNEYVTVKAAIGNLNKIKSGEFDAADFIHKSSKLSDKNIERVKQSKPGGSWKRDWDENLKLTCHTSEKGKTYVSIYGRMKWDEPAPTMTTFCTGIGNGRFGHPEQDRAISLREAAILQSFPKNYKFAENLETLNFSKTSKHIGNAVPPKLGEIIGKSIIEHLENYSNDGKDKY